MKLAARRGGRARVGKIDGPQAQRPPLTASELRRPVNRAERDDAAEERGGRDGSREAGSKPKDGVGSLRGLAGHLASPGQHFCRRHSQPTLLLSLCFSLVRQRRDMSIPTVDERLVHQMENPPVTRMSLPVQKDDAEDDNQAITPTARKLRGWIRTVVWV